MTKRELNKKYFEWMYRLVYSNDDKHIKLSYRKLLKHLHKLEFTYILCMDENRESDGIDLRYRFGYEQGYGSPMISTYLDDKPCSVLEMLVALAMRCEEHIMNNPSIGNRLGQWFWNMIVSLGLGYMKDDRFDSNHVDTVIFRFLNRDYEPNGEGGLFTIKDTHRDLRRVEIWYQMCWYLNGFL